MLVHYHFSVQKLLLINTVFLKYYVVFNLLIFKILHMWSPLRIVYTLFFSSIFIWFLWQYLFASNNELGKFPHFSIFWYSLYYMWTIYYLYNSNFTYLYSFLWKNISTMATGLLFSCMFNYFYFSRELHIS